MNPKNQNLPAGLVCQNGEFFSHNDELFLLKNKQVIPFIMFSNELKTKIQNHMYQNIEALNALEDMGLKGDDKIKQYCICRFGGFDGVPDLVNGELQEAEYFDCGKRGVCNYEGRLCTSIKFNDNKITKREILLIQLIASGELDKNIADKMSIAEGTLNKMKRNIYDKIGAESKVDVVKFAIKTNIFSIYAN